MCGDCQRLGLADSCCERHEAERTQLGPSASDAGLGIARSEWVIASTSHVLPPLVVARSREHRTHGRLAATYLDARSRLLSRGVSYDLSLTGALAALALTLAIADSQEALETIVSEVAITSLLPPTISQ
jgi:hypothetical protein